MIVQIQIQTNLGQIELELDAIRAPETVKNFLTYVAEGAYDGVIFHRCIKNFMIQCGTVNPDFTERPVHAPIKNESQNGVSNSRYTIAMARANDPNSAAAQWFINVNDNNHLDYRGPEHFGYAVFGRVTAGADVVQAIASIPTRAKGIFENMPIAPIIVERVNLLGWAIRAETMAR
jgi:cyclophilin family peptidyl-prolyl cis-trans isomerase